MAEDFDSEVVGSKRSSGEKPLAKRPFESICVAADWYPMKRINLVSLSLLLAERLGSKIAGAWTSKQSIDGWSNIASDIQQQLLESKSSSNQSFGMVFFAILNT